MQPWGFKNGRNVRICIYISKEKSWKDTQKLKSGYLWEGSEEYWELGGKEVGRGVGSKTFSSYTILCCLNNVNIFHMQKAKLEIMTEASKQAGKKAGKSINIYPMSELLKHGTGCLGSRTRSTGWGACGTLQGRGLRRPYAWFSALLLLP